MWERALWERAQPAKGWLIATRQDPRSSSNSSKKSVSGIPPASKACLSRAGPAPTRLEPPQAGEGDQRQQGAQGAAAATATAAFVAG